MGIRILLIIVAQFLCLSIFSQEPQRPKLVIGIVVDQLRPDYLSRFWNKFGEDGFKRLVNGGRMMRNAHYSYMPTATGPGHASIFSGATPAVHGIIGNNWFDHVTGYYLYCTEDRTVRTVGNNSGDGKMSPRLMLTSSLGDELKLATSLKSKVIGISLKDRGAILAAGHMADAAYWFSGREWITSSYYMDEIPDWVQEFNDLKKPDAYIDQGWETSLPLDAYVESLEDDNDYEGIFYNETAPVFPHNLADFVIDDKISYLIKATPHGNTLTVDFAMEAIKKEDLGKDEFTDLITVSFSATDYVGHMYGPLSVELQDTYLKMDQELARFLHFLDDNFGRDQYLVMLTADHAAAQIPAQMNDLRIPAGYEDPQLIVSAIEDFAKEKYGVGREIIRSLYYQELFLNDTVLERLELNKRDVAKEIGDFLTSSGMVYAAFSSEEVYQLPDQRPLSHLRNGTHPLRSGDVHIISHVGWMDHERKGTSHGSPFVQDTHVPLIFYGWKIKPGHSYEYVEVSDIAPTMSALLNISYPNGSVGNPIEFILEE